LESKSHYTLIGIAVLLLTAGLIITALWLSVGFDQKQYDRYIIYINEPVSGLSDDSPVKYNGVRVGYIEDISLSEANPQQVKITVNIAQGIPITMGTQASLVSQGITGTTYLGLIANSTTRMPIPKPTNGTYPVIPYQPSFFYRLEKSVDRLSDQLNGMLTPENNKNITQTLQHIEAVTRVFEKDAEHIDQSLRDLPHLVDALENGAIRVDVMARDVSVASKQFTQTMQTGKNALDQLSQQTIPAFVLLIKRLDAITANIQVLSSQLRQNPAIIIRGSAPPKLGPGEQ
jgi:phospholipid/cholesterol/gamma-HCH transport system substrate-binding protein